MSNVTLSSHEIISLYNQSTDEGKKILENKLGKEYFDFDPVKEIQSLEDACRYNGSDINNVIPWKDPINPDQRSVNAYAFFIEIYRAFNKGEVPVWGPGTPYKYSPWVVMPTPSGSALSLYGTGCDLAFAYVPARLSLFNPNHVKIIFERFPEKMADLFVYKK